MFKNKNGAVYGQAGNHELFFVFYFLFSVKNPAWNGNILHLPLRGSWPQVAFLTVWKCPPPRRLAAEMQKPLFLLCVSKMTKSPQYAAHTFSSLSHLFCFPRSSPISSFDPSPTPISLSVFFRSTGWRWAGWAKHPWQFHVEQTVRSREVRMPPQILSALSRQLPSCNRKSSSSRSRLRSSRQPGMTTLLSTSNWPTMLTNSKAQGSNR